MATGDPREAYVRFYLATVEQLDRVRDALDSSLADVREAVAPFADVLAVSDDGELRAIATRATVPFETQSLWRPQDPTRLTGIVDIYDVIGRFTFQGDDDENLARVSTVTRTASEEVERQRRWLAALAALPSAATRAAEGLSQQELAAADAARAERVKPLEPVAEQLRAQCQKVLGAIRGVARPDLAKLETADALYREYVRRIQGLYTAALPYLRRALGELCAAAGLEVPPSWPDTLPLEPALPPDMIAPPPAENAAMRLARQQLEDGDKREQEIARTIESRTIDQRRIEAEKVELLRKETEVTSEAHVAKNVVRWATRCDELDALSQTLEGHRQQRHSRTALLSQLEVQKKQLDATQTALQDEVKQRESDVAAARAALEKERGSPPAFFGKDEWRQRVADLEEDATEREATLGERQNALAQGGRELNALEARVHAEATQIELLNKVLAEGREREAALRKEIGEMEAQLGAGKPAHRMTLAQADEYLMRVWAQRNEVRARIDVLSAQQREAADEVERLSAETRQLATERQRAVAALEAARVVGLEEQTQALAALAERRTTAFKQHVDQVLAPFEQSLTDVDRIFIDPAREVVAQRVLGEAPKAGSLRAQTTAFAQALAQIAPRVEAALASQAETVRRVQQDFCAKVTDAVRAAWA